MDESTKLKVYAEYAQGAKPKEVEAKYGISYASALKLSNEFKQARDNGTVDSLINMDAAVLARVQDAMMVPEELEEAKAESFTAIEQGAQGLNKLDLELQATASAINQKIMALLTTAKQPSELETLTHCLCRVRDSFFKQNAQINVQNNFGNQYSEFLSDVPKSVN